MSVSDQKKKQIINAAITEFQEKGYSGASMDRISERAQVSKRTVYNHFDSKDALFRAINQRLADQINAALEFTFDPDQPIRDALVALGWTQGDLIVQPEFHPSCPADHIGNDPQSGSCQRYEQPHQQVQHLSGIHESGDCGRPVDCNRSG